MAEFFAELVLWLRGSDHRGTTILWAVTGLVLGLAALVLVIAVLLD